MTLTAHFEVGDPLVVEVNKWDVDKTATALFEMGALYITTRE